MDVTPLIPEGRQIIQSYGAGGFKVSGEKYQTGLIVTPEKTTSWVNKSADELSMDDFKILISNSSQYDVFLLGTGQMSAFPPKELLQQLRKENVNPDIMDTGAACRTYNVLMAEGRRVAALLLPL